MLTFVLTALFQETRRKREDITTTQTSTPEIMSLVHKTLIVYSLTFLHGSEYDLLIGILLFLGCLFIFLKFSNSYRFYSTRMNSLWVCFSSLELWASFVFLLTITFREIHSYVGFSLLILGTPFLLLFNYSLTDTRASLLTLSIYQITSPQQVLKQIAFFLHCVDHSIRIIIYIYIYIEDKILRNLLKGYARYHYQTCKFEDCPVSRFLEKEKLSIQALHKSSNNMEKDSFLIHKNSQVLIIHAKKLYGHAIDK